MLSKFCSEANEKNTSQTVVSPTKFSPYKPSPVKSSSVTTIKLLCLLEPKESENGAVKEKLADYTPQEIENLTVVGLSIINGFSLQNFLKANCHPTALIYRDNVRLNIK